LFDLESSIFIPTAMTLNLCCPVKGPVLNFRSLPQGYDDDASLHTAYFVLKWLIPESHCLK